MNIRTFYPNRSFLKLQYGSSLMSKMISQKKGKVKTGRRSDGFSRQLNNTVPDETAAKRLNIYKKPQIRMAASQVRKATLAEVSAAFDEAKTENHRRLENAGKPYARQGKVYVSR